jgi:hypothetical protein
MYQYFNTLIQIVKPYFFHADAPQRAATKFPLAGRSRAGSERAEKNFAKMRRSPALH